MGSTVVPAFIMGATVRRFKVGRVRRVLGVPYVEHRFFERMYSARPA